MLCRIHLDFGQLYRGRGGKGGSITLFNRIEDASPTYWNNSFISIMIALSSPPQSSLLMSCSMSIRLVSNDRYNHAVGSDQLQNFAAQVFSIDRYVRTYFDLDRQYKFVFIRRTNTVLEFPLHWALFSFSNTDAKFARHHTATFKTKSPTDRFPMDRHEVGTPLLIPLLSLALPL